MVEGILLIISGPSGVGKGTVCHKLLQLKKTLKVSVSTTTRSPRPGEEDGIEYHFTTASDFKKMIDNDYFLEWAVVHDHYYGTRRDLVKRILASGQDLILEIDIQGAEQVRKQVPEAISIFLAPPSMEALEERIIGRGTEEPDRIAGRMATARQEMQAYELYDYIVINDLVEDAANLIDSIIDAEKCKVSRGARPPGGGGDSK